jgi:tRNA/rRNA methyltransferase
MRIPTREAHGSMNLGQAVAVCLYELSRLGKITPGTASNVPPLAGDVERITRILFEVLRESGYVKTRADETTKEKVRRMVRRLHLEERDAEVWLGMVRQIAWKLGITEGDGRNR